MKFSQQLKRAKEEVLVDTDETRKAVTIKLFNSVIRDTPVDTGRARGNWQCSNGTPKKSEINRSDQIAIKQPGGEAEDEVINTVMPSIPDSTVYLTNNLPYAEKLELGGSDQAPGGMVRKNMARIEQIIREESSKT